MKEATGSRENVAVAYTQGLHTALTLMLSKLWIHFETCVQFSREERLALEKRVAELEGRPSIEYRGVWAAHTKYENGAAVTHDGSMWIAVAETTGVRPGDGAFWKLAVKRGRDAKGSVRL